MKLNCEEFAWMKKWPSETIQPKYLIRGTNKDVQIKSKNHIKST